MCKLLLVTVFHHSNTALMKTPLQRLVLLKSHPVCAVMEGKGLEDKTTPTDSSRALERGFQGLVQSLFAISQLFFCNDNF